MTAGFRIVTTSTFRRKASKSTGSTPITVTEPGRYAIVCFIPQGADPEVVAEAIAGGGEGHIGDGTPHALLGMVAEFQVEEA